MHRTTKVNNSQRREITALDVGRIKMTSADILKNCLTAGSKKRLKRYQSALAVTVGKGTPLFDDQVKDLLMQYALDPIDCEKSINYLNSLVDGDGILFSRNYKNYSSTSDAFESFSQPDYTSFRWNENYQKALEDMKSQFSKYHLKPVMYHCDADIANVLPKKDTHSGWTYILTGSKKKGDNLEGIYKRYQNDIRTARVNGTFANPILVGFRTQASGEFNEDGSETGTCKHKTRVVCMYDLISIIHELKYSYPIQKLIQDMDFYAGGKDPSTISGLINTWRSKSLSWWSIDYSKYDMTISSWLIEDAFGILKCAFHENVDDTDWNLIVNDFIHKDFIVSEGIVHADKGVPSGSMFTQIIDSIVNRLMVLTYFNSIGAKAKMIIMGDDNLIFHNLKPESVDELASYLTKNFGVQTNAAKSGVGTRRDNPEFLSRTWTNFGQWRHPHQLLSRLLFPERFRSYNKEVKPQHVIFAFILTYPLGMEKLINVAKFRLDYPISEKDLFVNVDSRYLPGALAYIREYNIR